jgi:dTDP-4-amino-4,6-dideoxygalactose transaminase
VIFETYPVPGFNYRMTDVQAAIGREQLKRLPAILSCRRSRAEIYTGATEGIEGLSAPEEPAWALSNWQSYCVSLAPEIDQVSVMQDMLDHGIATRRGIMCIHLEKAYADLSLPHSLRHSEWARDHSLILPLYPQMPHEDQMRVIEVLAAAVARSRRIRAMAVA